MSESGTGGHRAGRNSQAYFPHPLPDETAGSIIARYRRHVGMTHSDVSAEFFGKITKGSSSAMPPRMDALAARMPRCFGYDLERLVNEHTAANYYTAFMTDEQRQRTIQRSLIGDATGRHVVGFHSKPIKPATYLRFCSGCMEDQRAEHGEAFWRRTHQLPIVTICPQHRTGLKNSTIRDVGRWSFSVCPDDKSCPWDAEPVLPDEQQIDHNLLLKLAQSAEQLLNGNYPSGLNRDYPEKMLSELEARGYVFAGKRVHWHDLKVEAKALLSGVVIPFPDILDGDDLGPWLLRLREGRNPPSSDRTLLAHYVVSSLTPRLSPFGAGPWPCLNPLADHQGQCLVTIMRHLRTVDHIAYARFSCTCGYQYTRSISATGVLGAATVWDFGPLLEKHIKDAIENGWSLRQTHMKAGVGASTMLRHAARQRIDHPWREIAVAEENRSIL